MNTKTLKKPDGRTTCCGAFTTFDQDDGMEYCKGCYQDIEGYADAEKQDSTPPAERNPYLPMS